MAKKLCSLGVATPVEAKVGSVSASDRTGTRGGGQAEVERRTFVEVAKVKVGRIGDVIWLG